MIKTISTYARIFFIVDFILIAFSYFQENPLFLLNTQIAFISSLVISLATFFSFKNNVAKRLDNLDLNENNLGQRDKLDELDDPFDLYSDDIINEESKELSADEIKTILKEEKDRVKQNSFKNTVSGIGTFVSVYRLASYAVLIIGFFYLTNNKLFFAPAYLLGLFVVPLSALLLSAFIRNK